MKTRIEWPTGRWTHSGCLVLAVVLCAGANARAQDPEVPMYPPSDVRGIPSPSPSVPRPSVLLQPSVPPPGAGTYTPPAPTPAPGPPQASGGRPSFVPAPAQSYPGYPAPQAGSAAATPQPQTIVQTIVVPVPEGVSAPPVTATPSPAPATQPERYVGSPAIVFDGEENEHSRPEASVVPPPDPAQLLQWKDYEALLPIIESERNSPLASAVGWSLYNDNHIESAKQYFLAALGYSETNYEAAYGLALCLMRQNQYEQAEQVARWRLAEYPQMASVLGDIDNARAVQAYERGDYSRTISLYEQVKRYRPLSRNEQIVLAWCYFHQRDEARATAEFERLYREQPDSYSAQGLYASLARQKKWSELETLARTVGGPIEPLYQRYVGQRYYEAGLYANALRTLPPNFKESHGLEGYTSDSAHLLAFGRHRSGDSGLSRLTEFRGLIGGSMWIWDTSKFTFNVSMISLFAGSLPDNADVGTVPFRGSTRYRHTPITSYDALFDFRLAWETEGFYSPFASIGITPAGAIVSPTVIGNLGVKGVQDWGVWAIEVFRDPKKESILSYVGIRDPYTGKAWGRVVENGARASVYVPFRENWAVSGTILGGFLEGENVESNGHFLVNGNLAYDFKNPNFEYLTLGPSITYEGYSENLSYFTYGQGGYFSPQYWLRGTVGSQFQTHQGRRFLVRGSAAVGVQTYNQQETPFFPLSDSRETFSQTQDTTYTAYVDVSGAVMLSDYFLLGGQALFNRTGDYTEGWAGLYLRCFFERRQGIFATDFLEFTRF